MPALAPAPAPALHLVPVRAPVQSLADAQAAGLDEAQDVTRSVARGAA